MVRTSVSELIIKLIGLALALVGFALLLTVVGLSFLGVSMAFPWNLIMGAIFLGLGIYIIRGGNLHF